jgi:hypothetical protein
MLNRITTNVLLDVLRLEGSLGNEGIKNTTPWQAETHHLGDRLQIVLGG